ncbi:hypothetical protein OS175_00855 [Marinicella sp. S1101]|uniref:hypothetical protein n=1 Tax=Marinicella marina TaxID=2996016 RepID=UPI002260E84A|nr:hypothetical protein [Marinicella marina]MCX7552412.1 hypothetical protein [Marinicella marina]MDJ1139287.1 hypothetical protein [Marinicella marina]
MLKILTTGLFILLLSACGAPVKPPVDRQQTLIAALVAQETSQIIASKAQLPMSVKNSNIINLYMLAIKNQPYQLISNSQKLIKNFHHYNPAQQNILKPILLWAYVHPIYRQETAKQVRLLQREELLVAPSEIDFLACEQNDMGCASTLRQQLSAIIAPNEFTATLMDMAHNDPCINLTDENMGGGLGNQCLASRKGDLKVNLLSHPKFLYAQWAQMLNSKAAQP